MKPRCAAFQHQALSPDSPRSGLVQPSAVVQITNGDEAQHLIRPVTTRVIGSRFGPLNLALDMGDVQVTVTVEGLSGCKLIAYPFVDTYDGMYQVGY
jgi:hypothetical protein